MLRSYGLNSQHLQSGPFKVFHRLLFLRTEGQRPKRKEHIGCNGSQPCPVAAVGICLTAGPDSGSK